jgi:CBS domain-containing protein
MKVGDVMTIDVVTIGPDAMLKEAASIMVRAGVSGLPVLDDRRRVIGIITEADFVTVEAERSWGRQRRRLLPGFMDSQAPPDARLVKDAMTTNPHGIDRESSVTEAARKMTELKVKRLPVVLPDGTLDGIISRADVMGAFARSDEELKEAVEREVIEDVLDLGEGDIDVAVIDGVVMLKGTVPTKFDARLLEELVVRVEGVVAVQSDLSWLRDDMRRDLGAPGGAF